MRVATVCHLLRGDNGRGEIALGVRASLFANGVLNGSGGGMEKEDRGSTFVCVRRETWEEWGVTIYKKFTRHVATVDFYDKKNGVHDHAYRVYYFNTSKFDGDPRPLEGFTEVSWFSVQDLPLDRMMSDRKYWIHDALECPPDKLLVGTIFYGDDKQKTIEKWSFEFVSKNGTRNGKSNGNGRH